MRDFLDRELNRDSPERISVRIEHGEGNCDVVVGGQVAIEIKNNLHGKHDITQLFGQITDYVEEYERIIIVLVGKTDTETIQALKDKLNKYMDSINAPPPEFDIINKGRK